MSELLHSQGQNERYGACDDDAKGEFVRAVTERARAERVISSAQK